MDVEKFPKITKHLLSHLFYFNQRNFLGHESPSPNLEPLNAIAEEASFFRSRRKTPKRWPEKVTLGAIFSFRFQFSLRVNFFGTTGTGNFRSRKSDGLSSEPETGFLRPNSSTRIKILLSSTLVASSCSSVFGRTAPSVCRLPYFVKN